MFLFILLFRWPVSIWGRDSKFLDHVSFAIFVRCVDFSFLSLSTLVHDFSCLPRAHRQLWRFTFFLVEHLRVFKNQARAGTVEPASPIIESKAKQAFVNYIFVL